MVERVCTAISRTAGSLKAICSADSELPCSDTISEWLFKYPAFSVLYWEAKQQQSSAYADYIAERVRNVDEDNPGAIAKANLELKFVQWQNARLAPKRWSEKTQTENTVIVKHEDRLKELE